MSDTLEIESYRGPYSVTFCDDAFTKLDASVPEHAHFIIDARVADLYASELRNVLASPSVLRVVAEEGNKSLHTMEGYIEHLLANRVRRGHVLVAIGGGIIQDITCFLASTMMRGLDWHFYPTTLLAQADSCIGSKSSINVGSVKNLLGTFYPPRQIVIATNVLQTLRPDDLRSGVGEMLKVHAIDGPASFDRISGNYAALFADDVMMARYIRRSLEIKKRIIELDEFDRGLRNVMNYGHSFGHAIESATKYGVPHGIAVTLGMDLANYFALRQGLINQSDYERMHAVLSRNVGEYVRADVPLAPFFDALSKDKKNTDTELKLILPDSSGNISAGLYPNDQILKESCARYFAQARSA